MGASIQLLGDMLVRLFLQMSQDKRLAAGPGQTMYRVKHLLELFIPDQPGQGRVVFDKAVVRPFPRLTGAPFLPSPIEGEVHRHMVGIGGRVSGRGKTTRSHQFEKQLLHQVLGYVFAQRQPGQQGVQIPPGVIQKAQQRIVCIVLFFQGVLRILLLPPV